MMRLREVFFPGKIVGQMAVGCQLAVFHILILDLLILKVQDVEESYFWIGLCLNFWELLMPW